VRILNASRKHLILCVSLVPSPQNPDDDNLKQMQAKLQKRLEKAQLLEDARKEFDDQPVKYSIEFLALSAAEIRKFMDYFEKIDTNRSGSITSDELFAFIGERKTQFTDSIFKMLDSLNSDEKLDFGEFMKAIGTFCFFGKEEILRFTYSVFDLDGSGFITHDELLELLSDLHPPANRNRVVRALREVDLDQNGRLSFKEFEQLSITFPNLFFPAFRLQDSMRKAFFGVKWWEKKLHRYSEVKRSVLTSTQTTDKTAAKEAEKEQRKHARIELRNTRRSEARETTSHLRRTLLRAQLMADSMY